MDDEYSFDFNLLKDEKQRADKVPISADKMPISTDTLVENSLSAQQKIIYQFVTENGQITSRQVETLLEVKQRRARTILGEMVDIGVLERQGSYKSTVYVLKERR